jgi:HEPN domain-containing protein
MFRLMFLSIPQKNGTHFLTKKAALPVVLSRKERTSMVRRRRGGTSDSNRYFDWLERAEEDIHAAGKLIDCPDTLNACAFHCQQCGEKALKAYIIFKTGHHVDGHNLTWLCRQAINSDKKFTEWLDESVELNRYYIETRYPADMPLSLNSKNVYRAYDMARSMFKFICNAVFDEAENNKAVYEKE